MKIISHRGYWQEPAEKNSEIAFRRSFNLGFGTETDVRDCKGRLVIAHDMPLGSEIELRSVLDLTRCAPLLLALNIKSDGLAAALSREMANYNRENWFVFDMSIPDMRAHLSHGNPVFTRMSEVEVEPVWLDESAGVWLDSFQGLWFDERLIMDLINKDKRVCVVSAELHGRDPMPQWQLLRPLASQERLILCTDRPEEAHDFFLGVQQ